MTPVCTSATEASTGRFTTRAQIVLASCACTGGAAFLFAVNPSQHAVYPQCLLYNATGIYCAGCGATRALYALLHGRVLEALHDNVLFIAALPLLVYVIATYAMTAWQANAWPKVAVDGRTVTRRGAAVFALMIGFMIVRNLPGAPFEWLRPL